VRNHSSEKPIHCRSFPLLHSPLRTPHSALEKQGCKGAVRAHPRFGDKACEDNLRPVQDQAERDDAARRAFGLVATAMGNRCCYLVGNDGDREMIITSGEDAQNPAYRRELHFFPMLETELLLLFEQLSQHNPWLLQSLRPGLKASELRQWEKEHEAFLPQELFDLYCLCDGTNLVGVNISSSDETQGDVLSLPVCLDDLNPDCLRFTNTTFFLPFRETLTQSRRAWVHIDAYEHTQIISVEEIVLLLKPFVVFDYRMGSSDGFSVVPCTRSRYPSLPLFDLPSRDVPYFFHSSVEALIRTERRIYEEGLIRFDAEGKQIYAWMTDRDAGAEQIKLERKLHLECDPLAEELNKRFYSD